MNVKDARIPGQTLIKNKKLRSQLMLFTGIILVYLILNIVLGGRLLTPMNLKIILSHTVFPALVAWGMSFFFSTGIIDLSIGSNIILSANIGCLLATKYNLGMFGLIVGTILCVVIFEHLVIRCAISLKIPSWIAGLGAALVYEAILALYITSNNIFALDLYKEYRILGDMPYMGFVYIIGFILAYILFNRTSIGLNIRAVGSNEKVAAAMGIDKKKTVFLGALIGGYFYWPCCCSTALLFRKNIFSDWSGKSKYHLPGSCLCSSIRFYFKNSYWSCWYFHLFLFHYEYL